MRKLLFLLGIILPAFLFSQQTQNHISYGGEAIGFLQHVPYSYNKANKYPLIIFLHGVGERGNGTTDLNKITANSVPKDLAAGNPMRFVVNGKTYEPIILSPQCSSKYGMWPDLYVDGLLQYAKANFNIDASKIYLMGLSMGGGGTIKYASGTYAHANQFAAIATVCAPTVMYSTCNIAQAKLPYWAFHALDDKIVPVSAITTIVNSILVCNPVVKPRTTIYPTGGHSVWTKAFDPYHTYQTPNVFEWMLGYTKGSAATIAPTQPVANQVPIAVVKTPISLTLPINYTRLDGVGSHDPDGYVPWFEWSKISGPSTYKIDNTHLISAKLTSLVAGTYVFRLTLKDNKGATSFKDVTVTVNAKAQTSQPATTTPPSTNPTPGNKVPVSIAGGDQLIHLPINYTRLDGTKSYDPDGYLNSLTWTKVSGPSTYSIDNIHIANAKLTNLVAGTYTFRFAVKDNSGAIAYDDIIIRVNTKPFSNAGADQTIRIPTKTVTLNGSASRDVEGSLKSLVWTKVAGPSSYTIVSPTSAITQVQNLVAGIYAFRVTTVDGDGATTYDEMVVNVLKSYTGASASTLDESTALADSSLELSGNNRFSKPGLSIYPNPALSEINLDMNVTSSGRAILKIYDVSGKLVRSEFFNKDPMVTTRNIDISSLNRGVYMLTVTIENKTVGTKKFVKK